jgi:branched-chain amino acid transport system substrate-binding protein
MKSLKPWVAAAATLALAGALAACGSSGSSSSGDPVINIGMIGVFSGAAGSSFGGMPEVMSAWASSVNAAGGLGGRPVHVITQDAAVGTEPGLGYAQQLISQDHVVAIIDTDGAPDDGRWLPYASSAGVPVIFASGLSQSKAAYTDPDLFPVVGESPQTVYAFARQALALGPKIGQIYCAELPSCASTGQLLDAVGASVGLKVPYNVSASSSAPDYTAVCQGLEKSAVSSYYLAFASAALQRITDTCYQQGLRVPQLLTAGTAASYLMTDPAFRGSILLDKTAAYFGTGTPAQRLYRAALAKYAHNVVGTNLDNASDMWAWAAAQLIAAASGKAGGVPTAASLKAGLYELRGETLGGLVQPLTFTKGKPTWLPCDFVWRIGGNGQFEVTSDKPVCAPQSDVNALTEKFSQ